MRTIMMAIATIALSGCTIATGNPQLAINSMVATGCSQCQKDHYEYGGPYQFAIARSGK